MNKFLKILRSPKFWRWTIAGVLSSAIVAILVLRPFEGEATFDLQSGAATPAAPNHSSESIEPLQNPVAHSLGERAQTFAEHYLSFNHRAVEQRSATLAEFGEADWLANGKLARNTAAYRAMFESETVRTVSSVAAQSGYVEKTSAETSLLVTILATDKTSSEPIRMDFTLTIEWAYDPTTQSWLVTETDPMYPI